MLCKRGQGLGGEAIAARQIIDDEQHAPARGPCHSERHGAGECRRHGAGAGQPFMTRYPFRFDQLADPGVVDVIKAEDIAAFPDQNLAESLQRIPGVTITRVGGEGREISVRGLGPDYTRVRVNGMEALATSGGSDSAQSRKIDRHSGSVMP